MQPLHTWTWVVTALSESLNAFPTSNPTQIMLVEISQKERERDTMKYLPPEAGRGVGGGLRE